MARSIMSGVWKEERREDRSVAITYSHNAGRLGRGRPVLECPPFLLLLLPVDSPCLSELACSCPLQLLQSPLPSFSLSPPHPPSLPAHVHTHARAPTREPGHHDDDDNCSYQSAGSSLRMRSCAETVVRGDWLFLHVPER